MHTRKENQSYKESKLKLLHRLNWIERLESYNDDTNTKEQHWFRGYHIYNSEADAVKIFKSRRPHSCFIKNKEGEVTIMYNTGKGITHNTGVQFCEFRLSKKVIETEQKKLSSR